MRCLADRDDQRAGRVPSSRIAARRVRSRLPTCVSSSRSRQSIAEFATALESNRLMFEVLESIADAFVAVDRDLRITYVNGRMARFWDEVLRADHRTTVAELHRRASIRRTDACCSISGCAATSGAPLPSSTTGATAGTKRVSIPSAWASPPTCAISPRARANRSACSSSTPSSKRALRSARRSSNSPNKELESFSYSVSHDLRAPLRAIDGFSASAASRITAKVSMQRARGHLDRVRRAAQRMADLIDALLKLAKVARDADNVCHRRSQRARRSGRRRAAGERSAATGRRDDRAGLVAQGEPHLLQIVLANLLGNAWKFTRQLQHAQVHVGKNSEGEFYVRDNGAGFDMSYANKLFGAFARLHSSDEYEGTGIGLATVARIIHRHGGSIRAEGATGEGATFYFTLPAHEP